MTENDLGTMLPTGGGQVRGIRLLHLRGSLAGTSFPIVGRVANLGRRAGLEILFDKQAEFLVSGLHARIYQEDEDCWYIEDVGSSNGTFVNGRRLSSQHRLCSGDVVILGSVGETEGAAVFRVDIGCQATPPRPVERSASSPSVSPFRTAPMPQPPAGEPGQAPPPPVSMQAHPMQGHPGSHPAQAGDGGFLGLGRIKSAIARFMDRREVQRRLDTDRRRLLDLHAAVDQSCRALGLQAFHAAGAACVGFAAMHGLRAFTVELGTLKSQCDRARSELEAARGTFATGTESWRAAHQVLEVAAAERAEKATALAVDHDASSLAVTAALEPKSTSLAAARDAVTAFLGKHCQPEPDFEGDVATLGAQLSEVAKLCGEQVVGLGQLFARRDDLRELAARARADSVAAAAEVVQSKAVHALEADRLAQLERDYRQGEVAAEQRIRDLENRHAQAFSALGAEAVFSNDPFIMALGAKPAAAMAVQESRELEKRIAAAEAVLAELGG